MDTRTLVVGQDVYLLNSIYIDRGKVVQVESWGAEVQTDDELLRLDNNGIELETSRCERLSLERQAGLSPEVQLGNYPWKLDDMPFEERKAKQARLAEHKPDYSNS